VSIKNKIVTPSQLVDDQGAKILIFGEAGSGKTTICETAPGKTLVISAEAGLLSIKDSTNVDALEVKEAAEVMEIHRLLESGEIKYDTVCLDSISEISEILLNFEKSRNKDPRAAYGNVQESMTNVMRAYRDLKMHVVFLAKSERTIADGIPNFEPKMVGTKLGQAVTYFFDEVLALRIIEDQDEEGNVIKRRWLQTETGQGHVAKDRSGKLNPFEEPNLTKLIDKLGFGKAKQATQEEPLTKAG